LNFSGNWKEGLAGIDCFYAFVKRKWNLSIRTQGGCSLSQATPFNHNNIYSFFVSETWNIFFRGVMNLLMMIGSSI
jgi:hypothetical protein